MEAVEVVHVLPVVLAERLFVQIPEQMEGLYAHVGAVQPSLQERPLVLQSVRVNLSVHVGYGMIDNLMGILTGEPVIG
jgi:hypothetical protein